jgi:hypothetical protein
MVGWFNNPIKKLYEGTPTLVGGSHSEKLMYALGAEFVEVRRQCFKRAWRRSTSLQSRRRAKEQRAVYSGSPADRNALPRVSASAGAQFTPANWRL